ncbi:glycoside hydrolase family 18 protein [Paucibacter sp. KCTC 42545]|uniref:glycoside hydrolase family 18 protein n=1 Tax=Paucibacter sp. KCTC 42545 TaxID=1768242 RepID=UPI0009E96AB0|nr:glycoside hydrolase family 18 protein [Paucibacter sp. KCTC 42545]
MSLRPQFFVSLSLAAAAALLAMPASHAAPAASPPAYPLFSGKPLAVERTSAKVVGVYTPMWDSVNHVERLNGDSVTHLLYAFLRVCGPGQLPKDAARCAGKRDFELTTGPVEKTFDAAFSRLKARAPHVKVLASVGGWGGSGPIFHLAGDAQKRAVFIASGVQFLRDHPGFDGLDIDWEHPGNNGAANGVQLGSPQDGKHYAELLLELRQAVDALTAETGRPYLVSIALNTTQPIVSLIDFKRASPALDLVFMMTYDHYGAWSAGVGNHSSLRSSSPEADDSLERAVRNLAQAGLPAAKMVAGVAMYGRGFSGAAGPQTGAAKAAGFPGADGSLGYRSIAGRYLDAKGQGLHGWQARLDPTTQAWNLFHPKHKLFIGYDDPRAVIAKGQYAVKAGLAGVFAWELSQDNGDLLNAMNFGVGNLLLPQQKQP